MTIVDDAPNKLLRIDELYAFISEDETGEGVCAAPLLGPGSVVPMVAADKARLASLMPWANALAEHSRKKIKLIRFTTRHEITDISPDGGSMP